MWRERLFGKVCYDFYMRQKNTVDHLEYHNQFQKIRSKKSEGKVGRSIKDEKQGQSEFRVKKELQKVG